MALRSQHLSKTLEPESQPCLTSDKKSLVGANAMLTRNPSEMTRWPNWRVTSAIPSTNFKPAICPLRKLF